uniref:Cysteine-rich transmembrane CYSTM domain-containing protein n=1 Tax=Oryza meridionalis TaxID=40149 RepID=A0A0E0CMM4_9ORYZ
MASKGLLVFALLLAGAFLVNCAQQPQSYMDPADPSNDDPNAGGGPPSGGYGDNGSGGYQPQGQSGGAYGAPWINRRGCRSGCCEYHCTRCC